MYSMGTICFVTDIIFDDVLVTSDPELQEPAEKTKPS